MRPSPVIDRFHDRWLGRCGRTAQVRRASVQKQQCWANDFVVRARARATGIDLRLRRRRRLLPVVVEPGMACTAAYDGCSGAWAAGRAHDARTLPGRRTRGGRPGLSPSRGHGRKSLKRRAFFYCESGGRSVRAHGRLAGWPFRSRPGFSMSI